MIRVNRHYGTLQAGYLFSEIARRVDAYRREHPDRTIIHLGIGDVTRALPPAVVAAFRAAVDEMGDDARFRGYGPEQGYDFLRTAIAEGDFRRRGIDIMADEIFVSDGAKCDTANFQELFADDTRVAVMDPVYPVYVDSNVMAGRAGQWHDGRYDRLIYLDSTPENGFVPSVPDVPVDVAYLCFPNNPTGTVMSRERLGDWVRWARENRALLLFDAAYEAFIRDDRLPRSIFEIDGAREVAVEFRSFSKTAGFTGTRCAYTVVPKECRLWDADGGRVALHSLWLRRCTTKFNGVSYPVQRAAEAVYGAPGNAQVRTANDYYLHNARQIRTAMERIGYSCNGGEHSPYVWIQAKGPDSWALFEHLLHKAGVVTTPGSGFGRCGHGFLRISAFNTNEAVLEAIGRLRANL